MKLFIAIGVIFLSFGAFQNCSTNSGSTSGAITSLSDEESMYENYTHIVDVQKLNKKIEEKFPNLIGYNGIEGQLGFVYDFDKDKSKLLIKSRAYEYNIANTDYSLFEINLKDFSLKRLLPSFQHTNMPALYGKNPNRESIFTTVYDGSALKFKSVEIDLRTEEIINEFSDVSSFYGSLDYSGNFLICSNFSIINLVNGTKVEIEKNVFNSLYINMTGLVQYPSYARFVAVNEDGEDFIYFARQYDGNNATIYPKSGIYKYSIQKKSIILYMEVFAIIKGIVGDHLILESTGKLTNFYPEYIYPWPTNVFSLDLKTKKINLISKESEFYPLKGGSVFIGTHDNLLRILNKDQIKLFNLNGDLIR
ncbi:MAG: hypothetical protein ACK4VO_12160 [Pseudobdellovibrio sp.]